MFHNPQVVRNEEVGDAELLLQVLQQVDDLRLDRDVERRHRLVGDDQARLDRQGARDADALALPAAELVRIAVVGVAPQTDALEQLAPRARRVSPPRASPCISRPSPTMSPTRMRGFSEPNGS